MKDFKNTLFIGLFIAVEAYLLSTLGAFVLPKFTGKFEFLFIASVVTSYAIFATINKKDASRNKKFLTGAVVIVITFSLYLALAAAMYYFWDKF